MATDRQAQATESLRGISTQQRGAEYQRQQIQQAAVQAQLPQPREYAPIATTYEETYYVYVPREYIDRRTGEPNYSWRHKSDNAKKSILKHTKEKDLVKFEKVKTLPRPEGDIIAEQRAQVEEQAKEALKGTEPLLYPKRVQFTPRQYRESFRLYGEKVKGQVGEFVSGFETQVAQLAPLYGKQEYVTKAEIEARAKIKAKIESLDAQIEKYKEKIKRYEQREHETGNDYGERIKDVRDDIKVLEHEKSGWERGLKGQTTDVIQKYFTGYTEKYSEAQAKREEMKQQYREAAKKYAVDLDALKNATSPDEYAKLRAKLPSILKNATYDVNKWTKEVLAPKQAASYARFVSQSQEEKPIYDDSGRLIGIDSKTFNRRVPIAEYNTLVKLMPKDRIENRPNLMYPGYPIQPVHVYYDPETGKAFEDYAELENYMKKHNLPLPPKPTEEEQKKLDEEANSLIRVTDIAGGTVIPSLFEYKGLKEVMLQPIAPPLTFVERTIDWYKTSPSNTLLRGYTSIIGSVYSEAIKPTLSDIKQWAIQTKTGQFYFDRNKWLDNLKNRKDVQEAIKANPQIRIEIENAFANAKLPPKYPQIIGNIDEFSKEFVKQTNYVSGKLQNQLEKIPKVGPFIASIVKLSTPENRFQAALMLAPIGLYKAGVLGKSFAASLTFQKPLAEIGGKVYEKIPTELGYVKGALGTFLFARFPTIGTAVGLEQIKMFAKDPKQYLIELERYFRDHPWEGLGLLTGKYALRYAEYGLSKYRVSTRKVDLPKYGEVVIQKVPKYGEVVWVKGIFAQTEKIDIMKQIARLEGPGKRIFVQVSPKGIALKVFSDRIGMGFEVAEISNPMRGLYEAPPAKFLERYMSITKTNAMAASYYASLSRERFITNPIEYVKQVLKGAEPTLQRPFEYLRRTYKEVKTPDWIKKAADAIKNNRAIPKESLRLINKYWKDFLDKPIEWNKKIYAGEAKAKLLNDINLRSRGSGAKLKYYAAFLEYQNQMKVQLAGGAENLSGILPFGSESQVVTAIGTRFFAKSIADLRKAKVPTIAGKALEFLLGTKRGEARAMIEGQLVEFQPTRAFPKTIKTKTFKGRQILTKASQVSEADILSGIRRERITTSVEPLRPISLGRMGERKIGERRLELPRELTRRFEIRRMEEIPTRRIERRIDERNILTRSLTRKPEVRMPEVRRPEIRRPELRLVRRPEIRREEIRRPEVRRPEIRRPEFPQARIFKPKEKKAIIKMITRKEIIKPRYFQLTPTITQSVYRRAGKSLRRKKPILLSQVTGLEALRV